MAHEIYWDSREQRRIILEFRENTTWEEFQAGAREVHAVIAAARQPTDLIVWTKTPLPDGLALWRLSAVFQSQPLNLEQTIIIPDKNHPALGFARALAGIIRRLYPMRNHVLFADSLEDARRLLSASAEQTIAL